MKVGKDGAYTNPVLLFWPGHSKLFARVSGVQVRVERGYVAWIA